MSNNILVTRSSMPEFDEYVEEIKEMWDTHWLTNMGPKHKKLEKQLKEYLDLEYVDMFTNGHMALELSLQALNLKGEVITTPDYNTLYICFHNTCNFKKWVNTCIL